MPTIDQFWTGYDLANLRRYAASHLSAKETATLLGRSVAAVNQKAQALKIRFNGYRTNAPTGTRGDRPEREKASENAHRRAWRTRKANADHRFLNGGNL